MSNAEPFVLELIQAILMTFNAMKLAMIQFSIINDVSTGPNYKYVQRNLALELVRVTEAAALAAGRWLGKVNLNREFC